MTKDLIIDILIAIIVLGSVFGATHIQKLYRWTKARGESGQPARKPPQPDNIPYAQNKTAPPSSRFGR